MGKPAFCICENKDADQLRGDRKAGQRLCFRYLDSTIPLLSKSEISMDIQPGLCLILKTGFLTTSFKYEKFSLAASANKSFESLERHSLMPAYTHQHLAQVN